MRYYDVVFAILISVNAIVVGTSENETMRITSPAGGGGSPKVRVMMKWLVVGIDNGERM